jgi:hypothetical protein
LQRTDVRLPARAAARPRRGRGCSPRRACPARASRASHCTATADRFAPCSAARARMRCTGGRTTARTHCRATTSSQTPTASAGPARP